MQLGPKGYDLSGWHSKRIRAHDWYVTSGLMNGKITANMYAGVTITPLARELPNTLDMILGQPEDWKELRLQPTAFRIVSRLTALIFLGPAFMNNPEWQRIVTMYTADLLMACRRLNTIPKMLRPLVHWFLPECRKLRVYIKEAQALIHPEVERRLEEIRLNGGVARKRVLDSVDWFVASGQARPDMKEEFDIAVGEIAIAMAAVHVSISPPVAVDMLN